MLEYKDKKAFKIYVDELEQKVKSGGWRQYMLSNSDPCVYFKTRFTPNFHNDNLSQPYYSEISIDSITSCNTSNARKEIPSNFERVIGAVPYILGNKCMPIAVIKYGNEFYIENGKHRFYAHILLKKDMIPVSIREVLDGNQTVRNNMITIARPYYNNDGMDIAYPEEALDFFNKYVEFFDSINYVEMITSQDLKSSTLKISLCGGDNIQFSGCCTAGNRFRSSRVTCDILNKCGYKVDMKYINANPNFMLQDKHDAHNINFDVEPNWDIIRNILMPNIETKKKWNYNDEVKENFLKLHKYISLHKPFDVPGTHFSAYSSSFLLIEDKYYYIVGSENRECIDSIYIFVDSKCPFNNLTVEFLGTVNMNSELYQKFRT